MYIQFVHLPNLFALKTEWPLYLKSPKNTKHQVKSGYEETEGVN